MMNPLTEHEVSQRKAALVADLTAAEWEMVLNLYGNRCAYCNRKARKGEKLAQEHVIPVIQDGPYSLSNIVPACKSCNSSKGGRTPDQAGMSLKPHLWLEPRKEGSSA